MMKWWMVFLVMVVGCRAFEQARPGRQFVFPRDHGSHPEFRTEWWYITGHLDAADGRRFGFQVTFFRQASTAAGEPLYLAHAALLDAETVAFLHEERLNRAGWDAFASTEKLDVRNGNWTLRMDGEQLLVQATVHADVSLKLRLTPAKPLVVFGKDGVSKKGASDQAASHYLTFPRLLCAGEVNSGGVKREVKGTAWMDHEISSSQLDAGQVGWDWAAIQLHDGTDVMVYRMRREDGSSDPAGTTLAWIDAKGHVRHVDSTQFQWAVDERWTSPRSKVSYPIRPVITSEGKTFRLVPLREDQELSGGVTGIAYWEGACDVQDATGKVIGRAFLELAGYAGDLGKHLK